MKPEYIYTIILAAVVIIAWLTGNYFVNRSEKRNQRKQTRSILPEHTCEHCGCRTSQPDNDCYAHPSKDDERNRKVIEGIKSSTAYDESMYLY